MGTELLAFVALFAVSIADFIRTILEALPFAKATWFVIFVLGFSVLLFMRASKNPNSKVNWEDMIIDSSTNRTSPYKLGYLIGVIVSTYVVITFMDGGKLGLDVLGAYLTYLVGGAGFTEWLKHGKEPENLSSKPRELLKEEN